ncbi:MAG: prolipoprotein diacylglyceryl transferase family protein [Chitinophagales bacterium]
MYYWLLVLLPLAAAFLLYMRFKTAKFIRFSFIEALYVILPVFVFSYLGGRLDVVLHNDVLLNHNYNIKQLVKIYFTESGFGNPLGYTFSILTIFIIVKEFITPQKFLQAIDKFILLASFVYIFGNLGCFLDGHLACRGTPTNMPWGCYYRFSNNPSLLPLHPVKLYYTIFFSFAFLFALLAPKMKNGKLYIIIMAAIQLFFFLIDFIRVQAYMISTISFRQVVYIINVLLVLYFNKMCIEKTYK